MIEAEIWVMHLQAMDHQSLLSTARSQEEAFLYKDNVNLGAGPSEV